MSGERLQDHCSSGISNASKLAYYYQFKTKFNLEKYVECISNDKLW